MPSRMAPSEPLRRIQHALNLCHVADYVRWKSLPADWVREHLDQSRFSIRQVARLMKEHVRLGERVREQDQPKDSGFDGSVFYFVVLNLDGQEVYVKFILDPDEATDPAILIVSAHEQGE